jgi:prepilin-type N-terminal cleavage/methylation domain-containing protein
MVTRTVSRLRGSSGFTLLEILIALALLAILVGKVTVILNTSSRFLNQNMADVMLEDQAHRALDRVAYAILSSDRGTLLPEAEKPLFTSDLDYRVSLGVENGVVVWNDPENIGVGAQPNQLVWRSNPRTPGERRVVWSNIVRPFLEGEIQNGVDDNDNGIVDERGISFVLFRNSVTIRMTLGRELAGGGFAEETVETTVTVRNLNEES